MFAFALTYHYQLIITMSSSNSNSKVPHRINIIIHDRRGLEAYYALCYCDSNKLECPGVNENHNDVDALQNQIYN